MRSDGWKCLQTCCWPFIIYSFRGPGTEPKGHVAVGPVLESCEEPPALGFQGHPGPPSS